ncbi:hypothetical protein QIT55_gp26 [Nitrosopumilus spindle-shaped virus]|uniref:Uncharacterized protein n=1 Tax=Nitrosopumilus spindle-shaped virus 1 TaxID=2848002 RepID=A0A514K4E7_9VIRU|nr:hypothetical protein QIT55_gp26 [Nitrosopumilus spindle-shaped virus]QDI74012.1 hypothetical protein [Nitrosopumilus spindle-shaped virus]
MKLLQEKIYGFSYLEISLGVIGITTSILYLVTAIS